MDYLKILKTLKDYFLIVVIGVLLLIMTFKNNKIDNLTTQLEDKPQVEYVYNNIIDTFVDSIPTPVEIVKWYPKEVTVVDTVLESLELTNLDSAHIAEAYLELYSNYASIKVYDDILKDDSLAYIQLKEKIQYNSILDRELIYTDKTPIVYITTKQPVYTTSILGGIEAGLNGVDLGIAYIGKNNRFYKLSYDPYNKTFRGGVYVPIFNFKK